MRNHIKHCNKFIEKDYQAQVNDIVASLDRELIGHKENLYHRAYFAMPNTYTKILINIDEQYTPYPQIEVQMLHKINLNFDVVLTLVTSIGTLDTCLRAVPPQEAFYPKSTPQPIENFKVDCTDRQK